MARTIFAALVLAGVVAVADPSVIAATRTVTGLVSKSGSDYVLTVNGTMYTLKADDKAKAKLSKLVDKVAVVVGDVEDQTVTVATVSKQKKLRKH